MSNRCFQDPLGAHVYAFGAMGTACSLRLFGSSREQVAMRAALAVAEVERIEEKYSRYKAGSTLSVINRDAGQGKTLTVDEETAGLLDYAFACYKKSGGLFDITAGVLRRAWNFSSGVFPDDHAVEALLPLIGLDKIMWQPPHLSFAVRGMEIDFGGIAKEYAVDRLATLLGEEEVKHGLIDLGGDLLALGPYPDGQPWKVRLRDPLDSGSSFEEVALSHGALATSGDYERCLEVKGKRYSHILNPQTGWPAEGLASVTVLAPQCMVAGSITTIAILKGSQGAQWLQKLGVPHRWIDGEGRQGGTIPSSRAL
jgi:thiamine biosynthesis lipoprotein